MLEQTFDEEKQREKQQQHINTTRLIETVIDRHRFILPTYLPTYTALSQFPELVAYGYNIRGVSVSLGPLSTVQMRLLQLQDIFSIPS
jgi:hypothetical protein